MCVFFMFDMFHAILMGAVAPAVDDDHDDHEDKSSDDGMIVSIVLGTIAGLILLLVLGYWVMVSMRGTTTRQPQNFNQPQTSSMNDGMGTPNFLFNASLEQQELPLLLLSESKRVAT